MRWVPPSPSSPPTLRPISPAPTCRSTPVGWRPMAGSTPSAEEPFMTVHHIVLFRWKPETAREQVAELAVGLSGLPALLPSIRSYDFGEDLGLYGGKRVDFAIVAWIRRRGGLRVQRTFPGPQCHPERKRVRALQGICARNAGSSGSRGFTRTSRATSRVRSASTTRRMPPRSARLRKPTACR